LPDRTLTSSLTFAHGFVLAGDAFPAGTYAVIAEEESIEGLSFEAWHRTATYIVVERPGQTQLRHVTQSALDEAQVRDRSTHSLAGEAAPSPLEELP
jgi:hypothetical protein